jgi:imidazolonepropionase-like amidohydrolase
MIRAKLLQTTACLLALAAALPAAAETVAITNAHILSMGSAGDIASGTIVMRDGKIVSVGSGGAPAGARVVDAKGAIVTPGLVAPDTSLTITEVGGVPETNDSATSNRRVSAAYDVQYSVNPDSPLVQTARLTGITRAIVTPGYSRRGGADRELIFAGEGAVVQLSHQGEPVVRPKAVMVLDLGESGAQHAGGGRSATFVELKSDLEQARDFARNRAAFEHGQSRPYDLSPEDLDALLPVAEGRMPLLVHVHRASDIHQILKLGREQGLKLIFEGAEEGWLVAGEIAAAHVPVIVDTEQDLPSSFEALGTRIDNATLLASAGVQVSIEGSRDFDNMRQARFNAGVAVSYGLPYAQALAAVTVNPARIYGEDASVGALEPGKDADVVIWDGDPLEVTSAPTAVFIRGAEQPMSSRDHELRDRYLSQDTAYPAAYH